MLDHENAKKEDYMKEYWESFTKLLKEEEKYKEQDTLLQEMIKIQGEFNADEKNAAKVKVQRNPRLEPNLTTEELTRGEMVG